MSGPKSARYTLTPEQRRMLEEQRKLARRKAIATGSIKRSKQRLLQIGGSFSAAQNNACELARLNKGDGGFAEKFAQLSRLTAPTEPLSQAEENNVDMLESTASLAAESVKQAEALAKELARIAEENEKQLHSALKSAIDRAAGTSFADIKTNKEAPLAAEKEAMHQKLLRIEENELLPRAMREEASAAIERMQEIESEAFFKNFSALTLSPLFKKSARFLEEYEACREEFTALQTEYSALCELHYYVEQEYVCSAESIEKLKEEIERIKSAAAEDAEQDYISACLDEVMEEMGYTVLGSREVTKKNGKHFRSELYTYGEGTAVNITYASDGKIAMELGGIDESDRLPSAQEAAHLCASMEEFCEDFKEIERRLLAKGVVLAERLSMLPPTEEYAQIINTSDYEMKKAAESLSLRKQKRPAPKAKTLKNT